MKGLRITTGVMWAAITVICAAGAVAEFLVGVYGGAVVCLVVAVGAGWYGSPAEAARAMQGRLSERLTPDPRYRAAYRELGEIYAGLYPALTETFARLARFRECQRA